MKMKTVLNLSLLSPTYLCMCFLWRTSHRWPSPWGAAEVQADVTFTVIRSHIHLQLISRQRSTGHSDKGVTAAGAVAATHPLFRCITVITDLSFLNLQRGDLQQTRATGVVNATPGLLSWWSGINAGLQWCLTVFIRVGVVATPHPFYKHFCNAIAGFSDVAYTLNLCAGWSCSITVLPSSCLHVECNRLFISVPSI